METDDVWSDKTIETETLGQQLFRESVDTFLADLHDLTRDGLTLCEALRTLDLRSNP